jgi:hypothetical protein
MKEYLGKKAPFRHLAQNSEKDYVNFAHYHQFLNHDSNHKTPKYETIIATNQSKSVECGVGVLTISL